MRTTTHRTTTAGLILVAAALACGCGPQPDDGAPAGAAATLAAPAAADKSARSRALALRLAGAEPERIVLGQYHAFASPSGGFMLRKGRYKYHYYVGYAPELFDLLDDPQELHDLAGDPAYAATLAQMDALLRERLDPEAVDAMAKADQARLIERFGGPEAAKRAGAPGTTPVPGYSQE